MSNSTNGTVSNYLSLIKFSHTVFALPFAIIGYFTALHFTNATFSYALFVKVVLCMVFARSAAMAFNRYIDRDIDAENNRTAIREIPSGMIKPSSALLFVIANSLLFILTTYFINPICFYLSPLALAVILGYSLTKRFTALCHFILGLGLSLSPIGAYLAVAGHFDLLPLAFSLAVLFWVSGFDIIYALQDEEFDRSQELKSIPVFLGTESALTLSSMLHVACSIFILFAGAYANFGMWYWIGALIFISLLIYQHTLVKPDDLSKVNLAFFTTNGIASVIFSTFVLIDLHLSF
jgi:4-hydroxybenzoate polyprenyltransferase